MPEPRSNGWSQSYRHSPLLQVGCPSTPGLGGPHCRMPKHRLPCPGHKWETGNDRPENSLIPRPLSGNFLFPNMKKIKIGRQESQNMFAKPQSGFETPAPTIARLRIMAGVGNSGPVPERECTWTRARTMSVPHQTLCSQSEVSGAFRGMNEQLIKKCGC